MALITNRRSGTLRLAYGVTMPPGAVVVDAATWQKCRVHPVTQHYLLRGELVEAPELSERALTPPGPVTELEETCSSSGAIDHSPPIPLPESTEDCNPEPYTPVLCDMRAKDAIAAVTGVTNARLLRGMLREETRTSVVRAMKRRLAELAEQD